MIGNLQNTIHLIEPLTDYIVGRLKKDVFEGNSFEGLMATGFNRNSSESAYTSGVDWNLKLVRKSYNLSGQIAAIQAGPSINRKTGYGADITLAKIGGKWLRGSVNFSLESPEFITPDLLGFVRQSYNDFGGWLARSFNGNKLSKGLNISNSIELMNHWSIGARFDYNLRSLNDSDTFRGGSPILQPEDYNWSIWISSNGRKSILITPSSWGAWDESGSNSNGYQLSLGFKQP